MLWHWLALVFTLVHAEEKEASKTNCPVSSKWSNILNIVPLPNANIITQNGTYDVTCKDVSSCIPRPPHCLMAHCAFLLSRGDFLRDLIHNVFVYEPHF